MSLRFAPTGFGLIRRSGFARVDIDWLAALCPPLVVRCFIDGADQAGRRLLLLALAFAVAFLWTAVLARRPWPSPLGAQLRFAILFVLLMYEPIGWGAAALSASFGWVFAREMFGGKPVLSPALTALAFGLFADPNGGIEEQWITNAEPGIWFAASCLPGALWLAWRRLLGWVVPLGAVLGVVGAVTLFPPGVSAWVHLLIGSVLVGTLFVAADLRFVPEGLATQVLCGGLIGALVVTMRLANPDQPDGVVFALLLGGLFAPLIGRFCAWRPGHG